MILPQSLREGVIAWKPDGQDWADSLPVLVRHCRELWQLEIGEPFEGGCTALVAPAERADGSSCVLKLRYPEDESRHEPEALERWAGNGAVRLLERDEVTGALLLEHLQPGTSLREVADIDEAIALACGVLRRLWQPVEAGHPFATAQACAADWAGEIQRQYRTLGQPFDAALLRAAVETFELLTDYDGESVVLHQDFHRGNVLRAQREPWLAIDPKPLAGEPAFDARWLLNDLLYQEPRSPLALGDLLERLTAELSLDRSGSASGRSREPSRTRSGATRSARTRRIRTGRGTRLRRLDRLGEVGPEVVDVLEADGEPQQALGHAAVRLDARPALDQRLDAAEAGRVAHQPHGFLAAPGSRPVGELEGEDAAGTGRHLALGELVLRVIRQPGVVHGRDGGMRREPPRQLGGASRPGAAGARAACAGRAAAARRDRARARRRSCGASTRGARAARRRAS